MNKFLILAICIILNSCASNPYGSNSESVFFLFSNYRYGEIPSKNDFIGKYKFIPDGRTKIDNNLISQEKTYVVRISIIPDAVNNDHIFSIEITKENENIIKTPYEEIYFDETILTNLLDSGFFTISSKHENGKSLYFFQNKYWRCSFERDNERALITFFRIQNSEISKEINSIIGKKS